MRRTVSPFPHGRIPALVAGHAARMHVLPFIEGERYLEAELQAHADAMIARGISGASVEAERWALEKAIRAECFRLLLEEVRSELAGEHGHAA